MQALATQPQVSRASMASMAPMPEPTEGPYDNPIVLPSEISAPKDLLEKVSESPLKAKVPRKLSDGERDRIVEEIITQRLAFYMSQRPDAWILSRVEAVDNPTSLDYDHLVWNAIEWGKAKSKKNGTTFSYLGHSDIDGQFHMKLDYRMGEQSRGALQIEREGKHTHLFLTETPDWKSEFCVPVEETEVLTCNMAGAFDKYFLPVVRKALPELEFERLGIFPR